MKSSRGRLIFSVAVIGLLLVTLAMLSGRQDAQATASRRVTDASLRCAFLENLGYEVAEETATVEEVILPQEFDVLMTDYNQMQKNMGMDLLPYRGKRVKKWSYPVTNYPGEEDVVATLYVYNDTVVGGDIASTRQDGFCTGLVALENQ